MTPLIIPPSNAFPEPTTIDPMHLSAPRMISITSQQAQTLLKLVRPVTLPYTDLQGRTIQLWSHQNYLVASLEENGNISLLPGSRVFNSLNPHEQGKEILDRLNSVELKKWSFSYQPENGSIGIWPYLIAAGKGDPRWPTEPKSSTQRKIDNQKLHSTRSDLGAAYKENKGEVVARKSNGEPFNHIHEVRDAQKGFKNVISSLTKQLASHTLLPEKREQLQKELSEASRRLDHTEGYLKSLPQKHMNYKSFQERLQVTNLVKSFKASHPDHPMPERNGTSGQIGGVGNEVGIIEGMFDGIKAQNETEHAFFFPAQEGEFSLSQDEIQQLMHELAVGIFAHDTVPFFSLHFNGDTNMYPVIHPAHQNTFTGHVISMLDYYMKGFLNGGYFDAAFVEKWNKNPKMDQETLKANIIDVRKLCHQHLGPDCKYWSVPESHLMATISQPDGTVRSVSAGKIHNSLNPTDNPVTLHNRLLFAPNCKWDFILKKDGSLEIWPHLEANGWGDAIPQRDRDVSGIAKLARGRTQEEMCAWFYTNGYRLSPKMGPCPHIEIHLQGTSTRCRADVLQTPILSIQPVQLIVSLSTLSFGLTTQDQLR